MARHRLTTDFANREGVRYLSVYGTLCNTSAGLPIAALGRRIDVGNTWEGDEE
ncbi:hypothetical protein SEA_GAIL_98 [Mycobacterium phage Gail]|uniref:Uncharacterized protein n=1 Tax=Mycobacterium phage Gail TaxID=2743994 RepID=A0A7D5FUU0_9CAUD|nr:hypothetical protein KNV16_gp011 [Mycobacterium phage Gail]QLF84661.1 hypothetical protein SEA_GAIL_98 [Mycobacterium phage Gail]